MSIKISGRLIILILIVSRSQATLGFGFGSLSSKSNNSKRFIILRHGISDRNLKFITFSVLGQNIDLSPRGVSIILPGVDG
jgi:hypothetical protein